MARHPAADDGGKLAGLEIEPAVFPGRDTHGVFIEPKLRALIARIETAIDPRLRENINHRTELCVDEQTQPRVEKRVARRPNEAGRRATKRVALKIERAADACPQVAIGSGEGQRFVDAIEKILRPGRRCRAEKNDDGGDGTEIFHAGRREFATDCSAGRKRTSNSVHSLSEETRFNSPP